MRLLLGFFIFLYVFLSPCVLAEQGVVLRSGISLDETLPDELLGSWRIRSALVETNAEGFFKKNNIDIWNISRKNSVITLNNPFSGAIASVTLKEVDGKRIVFEKDGRYDNKILKDTVELYLDGDSFSGYNWLELNTVSDIDGHIMSSQTAKYTLNGVKISGENVLE